MTITPEITAIVKGVRVYYVIGIKETSASVKLGKLLGYLGQNTRVANVRHIDCIPEKLDSFLEALQAPDSNIYDDHDLLGYVVIQEGHEPVYMIPEDTECHLPNAEGINIPLKTVLTNGLFYSIQPEFNDLTGSLPSTLEPLFTFQEEGIDFILCDIFEDEENELVLSGRYTGTSKLSGENRSISFPGGILNCYEYAGLYPVGMQLHIGDQQYVWFKEGYSQRPLWNTKLPLEKSLQSSLLDHFN